MDTNEMFARVKPMSLIVFAAAVILIQGCDGQKSNSLPISRKAVVSNDGETITFPPGSPGLQELKTSQVRKGTALISVIAPARVVASILPAVDGTEKVILFESADVTSLYSQYRQSRANVDRTTRNLLRTKEMFESQGATAKDLNEAETDAATARATMAEMDGRLRAIGFNPSELATAATGTVWLICDVTEPQLHEVQQGEDVDVRFSAFPDKKYIGKEESMGAIVDPVTRTVKVRVSLKNPHGQFLPGMFAGVDFGDPQSGVILLPLSAIVTVEGNNYVFVETMPGVFQRRQITITNSDEQRTIVLQGLEDGENVVTNGAMLLKGLSFGF
ncbi:MAG TPA: efflux RND transporter periplasmic adaptor subunit [Bacteroidota bacterium]